MLETPEPFSITIIGAGTTGLLVAQGLRKAGISCTVFERTTANSYANRVRDWSMGLHWGSAHLQAHLPQSIRDRLPSAQTSSIISLTDEQRSHVFISNGQTGEVMIKLPIASSGRVSRTRLRAVLTEDIDIRYDHEISDIQLSADGETVTAVFTNGKTHTSQLLLGADSASSFVRTWLLGKTAAAASEMPIIPYNFTTTFPADRARWLLQHTHPLIKCAPHPLQKTWIIIVPLNAHDPDHPEKWVFQIFLNEWTNELPCATPDERLAHFKELAQAYGEPFHSAAAWVPEGTFVSYDRIKYWKEPVLWDNRSGRVVLAGDAAHPVPPHRAQGLNTGLADAAGFIDAVVDAAKAGGSGDLSFREKMKKNLDEYDRAVFARGKKEMELSYEQAYKSMHWDEYLSSPNVKVGHQPGDHGVWADRAAHGAEAGGKESVTLSS